jgi:hypothetical protein
MLGNSWVAERLAASQEVLCIDVKSLYFSDFFEIGNPTRSCEKEITLAFLNVILFCHNYSVARRN